jgi:hypothetical protein
LDAIGKARRMSAAGAATVAVVRSRREEALRVRGARRAIARERRDSFYPLSFREPGFPGGNREGQRALDHVGIERWTVPWVAPAGTTLT